MAKDCIGFRVWLDAPKPETGEALNLICEPFGQLRARHL